MAHFYGILGANDSRANKTRTGTKASGIHSTLKAGDPSNPTEVGVRMYHDIETNQNRVFIEIKVPGRPTETIYREL